MSNVMSTLQAACLGTQASSLCAKKKEEEAGCYGGDMITPEHQAACCLLSGTVQGGQILCPTSLSWRERELSLMLLLSFISVHAV